VAWAFLLRAVAVANKSVTQADATQFYRIVRQKGRLPLVILYGGWVQYVVA